MPTLFSKRRLRLPIDLGSFGRFTDQLTGSTPDMWRGNDYRVEIGAFVDLQGGAPEDDDDLVDITGSGWESLTLEVKAAAAATENLMAKTVAAFNDALTAETWNDFSTAHAVIEFSAAETNIAAGSYHVVVSVLTTGGASITLGTSTLTVREDGAHLSVDAPPENPGDALTLGQADVRFLRTTTGRLPLASIPKLDLAAAAAQAIDERIAGQIPSESVPIFSSKVHTGSGSYQRNAECWAQELRGITAISVWNAHYGAELSGTAISPRHIALAWHFVASSGLAAALPVAFRFVAADGSVVSRNLTAVEQVGSGDICIGLLDSDLPESVGWLRLLPNNFQDYIAPVGLPVMASDKTQQALVMEISGYGSGAFSLSTPSDATRADFYEPWVIGDSGNPLCLVLGNELVLMGCAWMVGAARSLSDDLNGILVAMENLGGGYLPTVIDLVKYRTEIGFAQIRDFPGAQLVPYGGASGEVLKKGSGDDFDLVWGSATVGTAWADVTGKPFSAVSTGGNGAADAGKGVIFNATGGLELNAPTSADYGLIVSDGIGTPRISLAGNNRGIISTWAGMAALFANDSASGDIAQFQSGNGDPEARCTIEYSGALSFASSAAGATPVSGTAAAHLKVTLGGTVYAIPLLPIA